MSRKALEIDISTCSLVCCARSSLQSSSSTRLHLVALRFARPSPAAQPRLLAFAALGEALHVKARVRAVERRLKRCQSVRRLCATGEPQARFVRNTSRALSARACDVPLMSRQETRGSRRLCHSCYALRCVRSGRHHLTRHPRYQMNRRPSVAGRAAFGLSRVAITNHPSTTLQPHSKDRGGRTLHRAVALSDSAGVVC